MAVARATIRTDVWDTIRTYLTSTNPISVSASNVKSAYNSTLTKDKGYPLVIIEPPLPSTGNETMNGVYRRSDIILNIDVYDDNAQDTKALADEITSTLEEGALTMFSARLKLVNIEGGDYTTWEEGKKKIHRITIPVTFRLVAT